MRTLRIAISISLTALACTGCRFHFLVGAKKPAAASMAELKIDAQKPAAPAPVAPAKASSKSQIKLASAEDVATTAVPSNPGPDPSSLSLDGAIETGLVQNPDLVSLRQAEGVSAAAFGVAATYPFNPYVQVQTTPYQQTPAGGDGVTYHYVLLIQQVQLAHQQQFREDVAAAQLNQVRWNICQAELLNTAQTARLYFAALYQRGIRDLTRSNAALNVELLRISERQAAAGQITKSDVAIVGIDARSTRQQAELAEANYQTALLDLRRQLNIPLDAPMELTGDLGAFRWISAHDAAVAQVCPDGSMTDLKIPDDGHLIRQIAGGRPDLMAARADIDTAYANYRLANASRVPDLQIGPYYQRTADGTYYLGFRAQMDLPVMNDGTPLVRQRVAEQSQRQVFWEQLLSRVEVDATAAVDRYERARKLVEAARPDFTTDLPAELQRLEAQFKANEVDVLRIFQARTSLIQNRRASLDLLNELAQATAVVTAATGIPPRALVTPAGKKTEY
ncbi:MAG: TolC family protein [Planctomycetia bacterium]|nr:TolC family protein [Planctomycetia bacterium]